ncbi:unnamed protein product [Euphydryas editha]|uniref:TIL domain-containing protein n=1 Tax=Euphydryas editha TaxID=104508 RepID=A0AAU9U7T7_EUPED|nr:unnamed protein product [Euphydryas editha]
MKSFSILCLFALVGLTLARGPPYPRGCIYVNGRCQRECEPGTHAYTTGCHPKTPEPTCAEPNPQPERASICDFTACYCDSPTVRNTETNKCVPLEECPK